MNHLKSKPAGASAGFGEEVGTVEAVEITQNYSTSVLPLQVNPFLSEEIGLIRHFLRLQDQATRLMESDPIHYAEHWAIWTSLQFKIWGWKWDGVINV